MIPKLILNFNAPSPAPSGGFEIKYRPKGSLQDYYTYTATVSPAKITTNILANVDYEGTIRSACGTDFSPTRAFSSSTYDNAVGNIIVAAGLTGSVTAVTFNSVALLPLNNDLPLSAGGSGAFVSNEKGAFTLVVVHDFTTDITITFTDSLGTVFTQIATGPGTITFPDGTINSTDNFRIEIAATV